ncbi:MAG: TIGR01458 family HAD-type hydrolase [Actinomycetota bacterium]
MMLDHIDGLLLDIDGVLSVSWEPIPGSIEAMGWLRREGIPYRLITNTTTHTRAELAETLVGAGFEVVPGEIVTAVVATASFLRTHHPGARVWILSDGDARDDLEGISIVDPDQDPEVVVLGGACDAFSYVAINRAFHLVGDGAALIGMHRNLYWRTAEGLQLDGGAFLTGIEAASGATAAICGKPSSAYFGSVLAELDLAPDRAAMVGDDIVNDVLGAQALGLTGVLVRTGKFSPSDLDRGRPDHLIDALADLPALLR